jgi:hypothetical protein
MKQPLYPSSRALRVIIAAVIMIIANANMAWAQTGEGGTGEGEIGGGTISVTDIAVVVNCILRLSNTGGYSPGGADANGDNDITVTDIGVIVDKILGTKPHP